jgi:magnesium chelatase family protein
MVPETHLSRQALVCAAGDLRRVVDALDGDQPWVADPDTPSTTPARTPATPGQYLDGPPGHRGLVAIAAAGGHNLLQVGPQIIDAHTTARQIAAVAPDLTDSEALTVTRIHSAAGQILPPWGLIDRPPLRHTHPETTSTVALIGGGSAAIRPGEISLAHHGILYLGDIADYPRPVLDALTGPLRSGVVRIARTSTRTSLPARAQLVASIRQCPCGLLPDHCRCTAPARARYARRLSGPLLGLHDIYVTPDLPNQRPAVPYTDDIAALARVVAKARSRAQARGVRTNAQLTSVQLVGCAPLDPEASFTLAKAAWTGHVPIGLDPAVWRLALTIADLNGHEPPLTHHHITAALALRAFVPPPHSQ